MCKIYFVSGEKDSHSLYFESKYNWTGILVEPTMGDLRYKQRKASLVYNCLALERRPHYVQFEMNSVLEIDTESDLRAMGGIVKVIFTTIRTMGFFTGRT